MYYKFVESKDLPDCYIVITSHHETGKKVRRYCDTLWEIVGFTEEDAQSFIRKYFQGKELLAQQLIKRLWSARPSDPLQTLDGLTKNPLNTTLLCIVFEDFEGALPSGKFLRSGGMFLAHSINGFRWFTYSREQPACNLIGTLMNIKFRF